MQAKGRNRIQFEFEFEFEGVRYRPTIERIPSEGNLRRAAKPLEDIKARIAHGTFNFALRCAFEYGYRDHPEKHNPASSLKCFRITKKDRPAVGPFSIHEAEALIRAIHLDWGETQGNYDEFRFFTGLRPSEQIALLVSDCDLGQGKIRISKARVAGRDKDRTKTSEDRIVDLCPRALDVLKRQLALRARLKLAGTVDHEHVFFKADGQPIRILQYAWIRWHRTLTRTLKGRYRDPYNARHSSVSWNLMGLRRVIEGAKESDVEAIRRAMESSSPAPRRAREAA